MNGILLMAHGAPRDLDEVEDFVLRVRHGRPLFAEHMAILKERYRLVGGSPLLECTVRQAEALQARIDQSVYIGMRYSHPYIKDAVEQMLANNIRSVTAICLAPQYSSLTVGAYHLALLGAIGGRSLQYSILKSYAKHPQLITAFATRLREALAKNAEAMVIFTAHSLPERVLQQADPYDFEVKETARLVATELALKDWRFAYQSQGMTSEKWLGPTVESRIEEVAAQGRKSVLIAPIGFVCDHLEILYDIDVYYRQYAEQKNITLTRTVSLNDSPEFIELLASLVKAQS